MFSQDLGRMGGSVVVGRRGRWGVAPMVVGPVGCIMEHSPGSSPSENPNVKRKGGIIKVTTHTSNS